jgi:hypothetical protein
MNVMIIVSLNFKYILHAYEIHIMPTQRHNTNINKVKFKIVVLILINSFDSTHFNPIVLTQINYI